LRSKDRVRSHTGDLIQFALSGLHAYYTFSLTSLPKSRTVVHRRKAGPERPHRDLERSGTPIEDTSARITGRSMFRCEKRGELMTASDGRDAADA
jgi:hypothetical protein